MKLLFRVLAYVYLPMLLIADGVATQTIMANNGIVSTNFLLLKKKNNVVFLTSTTHDGKLGGLAGADQICQNLAKGAGLPGSYLAWLSDSTDSPSTRFTQSTIPYVLVDGTLVASDWSDLTDGMLDAAIIIDEHQQSYSVGTALTHTRSNGTPYDDTHNCENWSTDNLVNDGTIGGNLGSTSRGWTNSGIYSCKYSFRLYCFQQ